MVVHCLTKAEGSVVVIGIAVALRGLHKSAGGEGGGAAGGDASTVSCWCWHDALAASASALASKCRMMSVCGVDEGSSLGYSYRRWDCL